MKYLGSKSRIARDIVPILQSCIDDNHITNYYEPFVGGANIIDKIKCGNKYGSDKNKYLIALLTHVQHGGELLEDVSRELYNDVRYNYNIQSDKYEDWYYGMIGFLASYNGRWFDGGFAKPGYEKTKNGNRYRNYYKEAKANLLSQISDIQDIVFYVSDYKGVELSDATSVIYCDPPYNNTKGYTVAKDFDYDIFWDYMRKWSEKHFVFISEEVAPDDFIAIWSKPVSRSIKATDKSVSTEKLFVYTKGIYGKVQKSLSTNSKLF